MMDPPRDWSLGKGEGAKGGKKRPVFTEEGRHWWVPRTGAGIWAI